MAVIPTPANQGAQRLGAVQVTQDPRTPRQSFAVPQGNTALAQVAQVGDAVSGAVDEYIRVQDETKLLELQKKWNEQKRASMFGENGWLNRRGGDAIGMSEEVNEQLTQMRQQMLDEYGFGTREARVAAEEWLMGQTNSISNEISRYEIGQAREYNDNLLAAQIEDTIEEGVLFYNNPEKLRGIELRLQSQVAELADRMGMSGEEAGEILDNHISTMYESSVRRAVANNQTGYASALLDAARERGMIEGDQLGALEDLVATANTGEAGYALAEASLAQAPGDLAAQLAYARANAPNDKIRDNAVAEIKTRFNEQRAIEDFRQQQIFDEASRKAQEGIPLNPVDTEGLDADQKEYLRDVEREARLRAQDPDYDRISEPGAWGDFIAESSTGNFADMTKEEFEVKYRMRLSRDEWRLAIAEWSRQVGTERSREEATALANQDEVESVEGTSELNRIKNILYSKEIDPGSEEGKATTLAFQSQLDRMVREFTQSQNRVPTTDERNEMIDRLEMQYMVTNEGFFSDTEQFLFELDDEEQLEFIEDTATRIPEGMRREFIEGFQSYLDAVIASGVAPTMDNIAAFFLADKEQ